MVDEGPMRTTIDINDATMQVINQMCLQQDTTPDQCINRILTDYVITHPVGGWIKKKKNFAELMSSCPVQIELDIGSRQQHPHREVDFS